MLDVPEYYNRIRACPTNDDPFAVNDQLLEDHFQKVIAESEKTIMMNKNDAKRWHLRAYLLLLEDEHIEK